MKSYIQQQLGKRIQELRKIKGLSQEVFAEKIGIATNTLSSIETGNAFMTSQTLEKILETLNISAEDLFSFGEQIGEDEMFSYIHKKLDLIKNNREYLKLFSHLFILSLSFFLIMRCLRRLPDCLINRNLFRFRCRQ